MLNLCSNAIYYKHVPILPCTSMQFAADTFQSFISACRQVWRLEEAKLLWVQSRHEQAIALTKSLLGDRSILATTDSLLIPQLRTLLGKWQSERRRGAALQCCMNAWSWHGNEQWMYNHRLAKSCHTCRQLLIAKQLLHQQKGLP